MFTGIIETTAEVKAMEPHRVVLERPKTFDDISIGSSICISGVCLSVVAFDEESMTFDIVGETLSKSKFGSLHSGNRVNLERSLQVGDRFEGHVVQGHSEGVGTVKKNQEGLLTISIPQQLLSSTTPKGSIALDGVSLTVASLEDDQCTVALIPHTLGNTTLGSLKGGDPVNIETDVLVRSLVASQW